MLKRPLRLVGPNAYRGLLTGNWPALMPTRYRCVSPYVNIRVWRTGNRACQYEVHDDTEVCWALAWVRTDIPAGYDSRHSENRLFCFGEGIVHILIECDSPEWNQRILRLGHASSCVEDVAVRVQCFFLGYDLRGNIPRGELACCYGLEEVASEAVGILTIGSSCFGNSVVFNALIRLEKKLVVII